MKLIKLIVVSVLVCISLYAKEPFPPIEPLASGMLEIDRFVLFGGSWGTTLGLTYAIQYPENVLRLILRGVFLSERQELDWFYKQRANQLESKAWKNFSEYIVEEERDDLILA